eukprot:Opistho-2@43272
MRINQEIIERYLNNEASEGEIFFVERWYASFENNPDGLSELTQLERIELENKIKKSVREEIKRQEIYTPPRWVWAVASMAAMLVIVAGLSFYFLPNNNEKISKIKSDIPISDWAKYENSSAKILKVILPDGSVVLLQPKTQLSYNQSDRIYRQVNLKGEAFFDVKRDESRPFLIYSGKMTTTVLGTSFNVKAYPAMETFEVSVVTGKVSEKNETGKEVILLPKQQVVLETKTDEMQVNALPLDKTFYWELSSLQFDDNNMEDVIQRIEQKFNVSIDLSPKLRNCRLSGNFENVHLSTILEIICRSIEAEYVIDGQNISLKGNGCP